MGTDSNEFEEDGAINGADRTGGNSAKAGPLSLQATIRAKIRSMRS
jgi:hypothetical protein